MLHRVLSATRQRPLAPALRARLRYVVLRTLPWVFPRAMRPGSDPAHIAPSPPLPERSDYLVFGVIDWHLRLQRPQHLATRLAQAGHRVFYVSSNLIPAPGPGFRIEPLDPEGRLFQVHLRALGTTGIYYGLPGAPAVSQMAEGLRRLLDWAGARAPIRLLDHPFWLGPAERLGAGPLVYDRMDYHAGFGDWSPAQAAEEERLIQAADLTVVSSAWLAERTAPHARSLALIRNAGDWERFAFPPEGRFRDAAGRRVIGYYGAIAPWLDLELVASIARRFEDCQVLLIGHDQAGAAKRLAGFPNVSLPGEVPYADLPFYLHGFDCCLLPFRRIDLTLATNPVKLYEYLAAGLPVVVTDLPEMDQFGDLVRVARDTPDWLAAIESALGEAAGDPLRARRRDFASAQTWDARAEALMAAIKALGGIAS